MKITKTQLREIIREEIKSVLTEITATTEWTKDELALNKKDESKKLMVKCINLQLKKARWKKISRQN